MDVVTQSKTTTLEQTKEWKAFLQMGKEPARKKTIPTHARAGGAAAESFNSQANHQNRLKNLLTNLMVEWRFPAPMNVDHYDGCYPAQIFVGHCGDEMLNWMSWKFPQSLRKNMDLQVCRGRVVIY